MNIDLWYFEDCPNWQLADQRLHQIAAERSDITVTRRQVRTMQEAERVGFHGSPSILMNGVDPFAAQHTGIGWACRRYDTADGPQGAPSLEQLRAVINDA
jgi:1,6-anhydro-N-acetylmuramate kinase